MWIIARFVGFLVSWVLAWCAIRRSLIACRAVGRLNLSTLCALFSCLCWQSSFRLILHVFHVGDGEKLEGLCDNKTHSRVFNCRHENGTSPVLARYTQCTLSLNAIRSFYSIRKFWRYVTQFTVDPSARVPDADSIIGCSFPRQVVCPSCLHAQETNRTLVKQTSDKVQQP